MAAAGEAVSLVSSGFAAGLISVAASFISTITMQLSSILFWMTIFVLIDVAAADGTSLSNNHATGSIVALASACITAATAVAPPRRSDRERSNVTLYNVDCDNEDNDDDNNDDDKQMNSTESLRPSRKKKKKKQKKKKKKKRSHSNDDYV